MAERALVIVPTYNERANIERLISAVLHQDPRLDVLIVDDNSPDGTGGIVEGMASRDPRVHIVHRASKMGLGTAYVAGFRWALEHDYAYMFEMDADFSHDPAHLSEFLTAIQHADLVVGSRYNRGRVTVVNWPMSRLILSYAANIYARRVTGLPLDDATGGFKCYRRAVLEAIDLGAVRSNGYAFQIEMEARIPDRADPDHVRGPKRGREQDVEAHRPRGRVDGVAAALVVHDGTGVGRATASPAGASPCNFRRCASSTR
jgi:dolichol-phosphate mannosyltransferase